MTVIAYKNRIMACDSLCADETSGEVWLKGNKIYRTKAGGLVGCSGQADARAVVELLQNIKKGSQMPTAKQFAETKVQSENGILVALPDGEVWVVLIVYDDEMKEWSADACRITGMGGMAVAGCGGRDAMMAMRCGKSAREAVEMTCDVNAFCARPTYAFSLDDKPKSKR